MATLSAKITLSSTDLTSDALNMTVSDAITVSKAVELKRITLSTTSVTIVGAASYTKAFVFVKNIDTAININLVKSLGKKSGWNINKLNFLNWHVVCYVF